ncbi:MAG: serine hydrolase [Acidobacteriota bacterium]
MTQGRNRSRALATLQLATSIAAVLVLALPSVDGIGAKALLPQTATSGKKSDLVTRLQQKLPTLMSDGEVPGLAIAIVENGALIWAKGFGISNTTTKAPVTDDTVFEAASLSKPVFAYAVLKLVDAGKFDLDTPLTKYLPGTYDVGDDPRLGQITARHVLSHTTGFPNWRPRGESKLKIHFTPGERFSYSGEGFVYLSKVIVHVTGEPFDAFMKRMVFVPLGMTSSSYVWQSRYESQKTFPHDTFGVAGIQNRSTAPNAAASLNTTAADYGRFLAAILNGTGPRKETARLMLTPQIKVGQRSNSIDRTLGPLSESISWGLGVGLEQTSEGASLWHWGDNGDSKAYVVASEKPKTGLVVFMNSANGLSIISEIIEQSIGGVHPALKWVDYESYKSPVRTLLRNLRTMGAERAIAQYREWRKSRPREEQVTEAQMNRLGYNVLLGLKKPDDAIELFKLNVEDYPASSNAFDSLAEGYMVAGKNELAIKNYERSIELNPNNTDGKAKLLELRPKLK